MKNENISPNSYNNEIIIATTENPTENNTTEKKVEKQVEKKQSLQKPIKSNSTNNVTNGNNEKKWGIAFLFNLLSGNKKKIPAQKKRNNLVFRKISKAQQRELNSTTWISLIQLGLWDNTTGPRVEVIWKGTEHVPEDVQQYALKITIIADLAQKTTSNNNVETKFHLYSELGYVIIATSFSTMYEETPSKFSLNLIIRKECLDRYLILHKVIEDRMKRSAKIMQKLIQKKLSVADTFTKYIPNFELNLDALYHASLPSSINFPSTFFCNKENYETEFLSRVITSHLQTHGYSIIIGKEEKDINMFIESLSIFLEPKDRSRCSFVVEGRGFIPDLLIQGISDESLFKIDDVVQTMMPTSIINISKKTVTKTCAYHEFIIHRKNFLRTEKKNALVSDNTSEPKVTWAPGESFFDNVKSSNTSVFANTLLKQTFELPISLRAGFVSQQYRMLKKRAIALITFVEYETKQNDILEAQRLMEIKQDIGCENSESDFTILLAIAEKLKPGMYQCVAGNLFRRIYELFNSF